MLDVREENRFLRITRENMVTMSVKGFTRLRKEFICKIREITN